MTVTITTNAERVAEWLRDKLAEYPRAVREATKEIERETLRDLRRTAATWHHQPKFEVITEMDGASFEMLAGTDDPIWNMLDAGTRAHPIYPVHAKLLRFQTGYNAKTIVGALNSTGGGPFGDVVFAKGVQHPGTEARGWSKLLIDVLTKRVPDLLLKAIRRWKR